MAEAPAPAIGPGSGPVSGPVTDWPARLAAALARAGGPTSDHDLNPGLAPAPGSLRPAAVLVAIEGGQLILTKRSSRLSHHPGQIAFPGGRVDPGDASAVAAALREAEEEIGLPPAAVEVLGTLPPHTTVTGFSVTPVVGRLRAAYTPRPEPGEVDEVFNVPLAHVLDPGKYAVQWRLWRGTRRFYDTVPYGPYYIWGATARILAALAARLDP